MDRLPKEPPASEITPEPLFLRRRELMKNTALTLATATGVGAALLELTGGSVRHRLSTERSAPAPTGLPVQGQSSEYTVDEPRTPYDHVTRYNNFYELGFEKHEPAENAGALITRPWTVRIEGEVKRPETLDIDRLLALFPHEERVYRMRCVEAWSMVIPWLGFPLAALLARAEPTSRARYVAFTSIHAPEQLPGQEERVLEWPYTEGLRLDEAMHPTRAMQKRLGGVRWRRLHRLSYVAAGLGLVHFFMRVKKDASEPIVYGLVLGLLLLARLYLLAQQKRERSYS